jgi:hypothetical protein
MSEIVKYPVSVTLPKVASRYVICATVANSLEAAGIDKSEISSWMTDSLMHKSKSKFMEFVFATIEKVEVVSE